MVLFFIYFSIYFFIFLVIGHYVPQLAQLIIQSNLKINLKGIAVSRTLKYNLWNSLKKFSVSDNIDQSKFLLICTILQIGNPLLDFTIDLTWPYEYYWSHGLISDDIYQLVTKVCNGSAQIMRGIINQEGSDESACIAVLLRIKQLTDTTDPFDVTGDICLSPVKSQMDMLYKAFLS